MVRRGPALEPDGVGRAIPTNPTAVLDDEVVERAAGGLAERRDRVQRVGRCIGKRSLGHPGSSVLVISNDNNSLT